jgi:hypothetical protein
MRGGYSHRFYRQNPMGLADVIEVARRMGKLNLAALLEQGGPAADALVAEINAVLDAPEPKRLTDREAWLELAALVPQAFADQPEAVRTALVQAFRQQAA